MPAQTGPVPGWSQDHQQGNGWQIVGSFLRRRRLIALSLALLAASWAGLAIGAVLLVMGSGAVLGWAAAGGLIAVVIGWLLIYASFTAGRR